MLHDVFLSADLAEHFVGICVVDHYSFEKLYSSIKILEYKMEETLESKNNLILDSSHDKNLVY